MKVAKPFDREIEVRRALRRLESATILTVREMGLSA